MTSAHEDVSAPPARRISSCALISFVAGGIAAGGMVGFGTPVLAVFAVGAGHAALARTRAGQERGRSLAWVGLVLGYGLGVWGLALVVGSYVPAVLSQRD